jgi:hypothetical protein
MVIFKSFAMSPQLAQISWTQAFHLPQPPKHLGLDTHYHTQLALQLLKKEKMTGIETSSPSFSHQLLCLFPF